MARASNFAVERARQWRELASDLVQRVGGDAVTGEGNEDNMRVALDFAIGNFEGHTFGTFSKKDLRLEVVGLAEKFSVHSLDEIGHKLVFLHDRAVSASKLTENETGIAGTVDEGAAGCRTARSTSAAIRCILSLARAPMESIWERLPEITQVKNRHENDDAADASRDGEAEIVAWNLARLEVEDDDGDEWMREFKRSANSSGSEFSSSDDDTEAEEEDLEEDKRSNESLPLEANGRKDPASKRSAVEAKSSDAARQIGHLGNGTAQEKSIGQLTSSDGGATSNLREKSHLPTREPRSMPGPQTYQKYSVARSESLITACRDDYNRRHKFTSWPYHIVEEKVVVREALSVLQGHSGSIFQLFEAANGMGKEFVFNRSLCLPQLSPSCLKALLSPVLDAATDLARMRTFCEAHTTGTPDGGTVWVAFVTAVQTMIAAFDDEVGAIINESVKRTMRNGNSDVTRSEVGTVFALHQWISAHRERLLLLSTLLADVQAPFFPDSLSHTDKRKNCVLNGHLMTVVHDMLSCSTLVRDALSEDVLWNIFESILTPWGRILGPWVDFGILEDQYDEFFICKHPDSKQISHGNLNRSVGDWESMFVVDWNGVPDFMQEVANAILLSGKSQHVRSRSEPLAIRRSKWPELMANLHQRGNFFRHEPIRAFLDRILIVPLLRAAEDASLALLRSMFFSPNTITHQSFHIGIIDRASPDLKNHLLLLRACFMLSDVELLRPFTESMFDQLEKGRWHWDNDITIHFRRSMQKRITGFGGLVSKISKWYSTFDLDRWSATLDLSALKSSMVPSSTSNALPNNTELGKIDALDGLRIHFAAPWPLSIVLDNAALEGYNRIMRLLLQVKRSKFIIDKTHTTLHRRLLELQKNGCGRRWLARDENLKHNGHTAGLLLMELMHFVNHFHAYLMDQAVRTECDKFYADLETINLPSDCARITSVDALRKRHQTFLDNISDRCLLHPRSRVALQQVQKILDCCLQIAGCVTTFLDLAPQRISWTGERKESIAAPENSQLSNVLTRMQSLRRSFRRTNRFLIVLIQSHIRHAKGAASFLESILTAVDFTGFYSRKDSAYE